MWILSGSRQRHPTTTSTLWWHCRWVPVRTIKVCSVLFGVAIDGCCRKRDSLMRGINRCPHLVVRNYSTVEIVDHSPPVVHAKVGCWSRIAIYLTPLLGWSASEYCHDVWCGKSRIVWLSDAEKILQHVYWFDRITNRRTDTTREHRPHLCIALDGRNYGTCLIQP